MLERTEKQVSKETVRVFYRFTRSSSSQHHSSLANCLKYILFLDFSRGHLRSTVGISCGRRSFAFHFGDFFFFYLATRKTKSNRNYFRATIPKTPTCLLWERIYDTFFFRAFVQSIDGALRYFEKKLKKWKNWLLVSLTDKRPGILRIEVKGIYQLFLIDKHL